MANRILLGKKGSNYVLQVSEPGDNVLSPSEPLIFDSTSVRSGMVYAGGNASSTTGVNWSATKGQLGFIPLVISMDDNGGNFEEFHQSQVDTFYQRGNYFETSLTSVTPRAVGTQGGSRTAANLKFFVLRLPLQYGKMNDSSLWT